MRPGLTPFAWPTAVRLRRTRPLGAVKSVGLIATWKRSEARPTNARSICATSPVDSERRIRGSRSPEVGRQERGARRPCGRCEQAEDRALQGWRAVMANPSGCEPNAVRCDSPHARDDYVKVSVPSLVEVRGHLRMACS